MKIYSILWMTFCLTALTSLDVCYAETADAAAERHRLVAERRQRTMIICHRGANEFAYDNTMEAYRATFTLGADGNEIDVRMTSDGVLVCFHDDMLDSILTAYGDVSDYTWEELQRIPFRNPGKFGAYARIPTLREVLELHRDQAGLVFLDIKRPGLGESIGVLLEELDMWDHVVSAPSQLQDSRIKYNTGSTGLYLDHAEVFAGILKNTISPNQPGQQYLVDDPRGLVTAFGRESQIPSDKPYKDKLSKWSQNPLPIKTLSDHSLEELLAKLRETTMVDQTQKAPVEGTEADQELQDRITFRVQLIDELGRRGLRTAEVYSALEDCVRYRTLHPHWRYTGLDGITALRALAELEAPRFVELARFCLWRDDPQAADFQNPAYKNPRSWVDWRTKIPVFELLAAFPGEETEQLCRDYLALSSAEAEQIGIDQFESATRTLLTISPNAATARELMQHRLSAVRGRVVLFALAHPEKEWSDEIVQLAAGE
ncbi:MAG: glycerophosphodiester phosphodiesterase family protein [Planctomycetaceae bacterium]